jgi:EARP and GARP complex-interacting protein 1
MWGQASTYSVKFRTRCLAAYNDGKGEGQTAEHHLFMVGTTALREENEIHVVEYVEDSGSIQCCQVFHHPSEVWDVQPCPGDNKLLFTAYNTGSTMKGTLWNLPDPQTYLSDRDASDLSPSTKVMLVPKKTSLEQVLTLDHKSHIVGAAKWEPQADSTQRLLSWAGQGGVSDEVCVWDIRGGGAAVSQSYCLAEIKEAGDLGVVYCAAWDPHCNSNVTFAVDSHIMGWDLRASGSNANTFTISNAHGLAARDIDYNPNKPYCFLSGGDDGKIKFWDYRQTSSPLKVLSSHSHWATAVKYNPFHDQLVLSGSTDRTVALWRAALISSAPLLEFEGEEGEEQDAIADGLIRRFDEHEESVYGLAWSLCDAWVFASLSYDGRFVINHVPSAEKYKILL